MAHYEHIGYDPVPGDHTVTSSLSAGLTGGHETLERVKFLLGSVDEGEWVGEAAIAFRSMLHDDFEPKVTEAEEAFRVAAGALDTWAGDLHTFRDEADRLDRELGTARAVLADAERSWYGMPDVARPDDDAPQQQWDAYEDHERARARAQENLADAQAAVDAVWVSIRELASRYDGAARRLLDRFDTAAAMAPDDPSWWDRAVDWMGDRWEDVTDLVADIGDYILEWAAEHAGFLNTLSNWLSIGSMILGFASLIPGPWSPALAALSVALGAASTLAGYLSAAGQAGSWSEGFTPGVVAGMVGTALGIGALGATFRATAAAATTAGRTAPTFAQFMNPLSPTGRAAAEVLPGFFTLAARGGSIDSVAEFGWRSVDVMFDQGTWFGTNPIGVLNMGWDVERDGESALLRTQAEKQGAL
ncbi:hypothetical protein [Isoptericola variabilis]|uniref:Uncharacterized protein n=1 Tax=Isoptericola variabilis (strain 225) TaxID=743718 RepID=F6FQV3_ISOV2|nr:hypothetical protein [Isoptericola variabilis]AEG42918.1 hypothetical protein Isova_0104 [Isoptericola variabilis 225]TWH31833.1 hypothetical protein L600_002000000420 [Isoptericola variabilis J7]